MITPSLNKENDHKSLRKTEVVFIYPPKYINIQQQAEPSLPNKHYLARSLSLIGHFFFLSHMPAHNVYKDFALLLVFITLVKVVL